LLKAMSEVDYEFTEADFDTALDSFLTVCHRFDYRQLGPAGWAAFKGESLTPAEFRETMKRTFGIRIRPRELGALVTYFDTDMKGVVNCSSFMSSFVQIRVRLEDFKVRLWLTDQHTALV
jgi:EF-hand domain pair